jgi:hypothetical protein
MRTPTPSLGGVGTTEAFDEGLTRPHPEDDRVPAFDAPALKGDLRRLCYW